MAFKDEFDSREGLIPKTSKKSVNLRANMEFETK